MRKYIANIICLTLGVSVAISPAISYESHALAPSSAMQSEKDKARVQARGELEELLGKFSKKYQKSGKNEWNPSAKVVQNGIRDAANRYFFDGQAFLDIDVLSKDRVILLQSKAGSRPQQILILSIEELSIQRIGELIEQEVGSQPLRQEKIGNFYACGVDLAVLSRRKFMVRTAKVAAATAVLSGVFYYWRDHLHGWLDYLLPQHTPIPRDADVTIVYGNHEIPDDQAPQLRLLSDLVKRHKRKFPDRPLLHIVEHLPRPFTDEEILSKEAPFRTVAWKGRDPYEILQDKNSWPYLEKEFLARREGHNYSFRAAFVQRIPEAMRIYSKHGNTKLMLDEEVEVVPEPIDFEAWRQEMLDWVCNAKTEHSLADGLLDEAVLWKTRWYEHRLKASILRDETMSQYCAERRKNNPRLRIFSVRGEDHMRHGIFYERRGLDYLAMIPVELRGGMLLSSKIQEDMEGGRLTEVKKLKKQIIRGLVYSLLVGIRIANHREYSRVSTANGDRMLQQLERKVGDLESWLRKMLKPSPAQDSREPLLQSLVDEGILSPRDIRIRFGRFGEPKAGLAIWPLTRQFDMQVLCESNL